MQTHEVKTDYNSGMSFTAHIDQYAVTMDSNDENGGNTGPGAKKLMLASLAGCTGIDVVSILNKMKVSFSDLSIGIRATLTEDHPKIYKEVNLIYTIQLAAADRPKMEKAVQLSMEKYCGVNAMFRAFAEVTSSIVYL